MSIAYHLNQRDLVYFQFFHRIPITLTIRHYQNELLINKKWTWWFNFAIQWFYRRHFMEFKKVARFQKDLIFMSAKLSLLWLCRFITINYRSKLGFHTVIQIFHFFLNLTLITLLIFCWRDNYKIIEVNYQLYLLIPFKLGYEVLVVEKNPWK